MAKCLGRSTYLAYPPSCIRKRSVRQHTEEVLGWSQSGSGALRCRSLVPKLHRRRRGGPQHHLWTKYRTPNRVGQVAQRQFPTDVLPETPWQLGLPLLRTLNVLCYSFLTPPKIWILSPSDLHSKPLLQSRRNHWSNPKSHFSIFITSRNRFILNQVEPWPTFKKSLWEIPKKFSTSIPSFFDLNSISFNKNSARLDLQCR